MPSAKSQNRTNSINAGSKRKENTRKMKQHTRKTLQPTNDEKQKRGTSTNVKHGEAAEEKIIKTNKTNQSRQTASQTEMAKVSNCKSQPQYEKDSKIRKGKNKHIKLTQNTLPSTRERVNKMLPTNSENETSDNEISDAGSSEEASEAEITNCEKKEERGSNQVAAEKQESEDSGDEPEASDTQSEAEQSVNKESVEDKTKRAASPVQLVASTEEDHKEEVKEDKTKEDTTEEGNRRNEADVCEKLSDETEIEELKQKETKKSNITQRQCGQSPDLSETGKETKNKMFKKAKTEKKSEKDEKQSAKTEKNKLLNEAKQKARREKKKNKEQNGDNPSHTEEGKVHFLHSNSDSSNGKNQMLKKGKHLKERDSVVDSLADVEKVELEPIITKFITDQSPKSFLKTRCRDLKVTSEPKKQQAVKGVMKGKPQSFLLSKIKKASPEFKGDKTGTKSDEELLECDGAEGMPSNFMKSLITQRKKAIALHRMSGWIQKKMPQKFNFRKKISVLTKAIGVSHWLSRRSMKRKQNTRKTKVSLFKHRMAMRVASKTSLTNVENKNSSTDKDGSNLQGKTKDRADKALQGGDKMLEARFAVVLPRMNKICKMPPTALTSSTPSCQAGLGASEPKRPKPDAKFVLSVKPDLSLLETIRKPGREGLMADMITNSTGSIDASEESSKSESRTKKLAMENKDEVSVLQAARGKLKPSQMNLSKMPARSINDGQTRLKGPNTGREDATGTHESTPQHAPNGDTRATVLAICSQYEEETDKEVAQLMGEAGSYTISKPEVHWTGSPCLSGVPHVCVMSLVLHPCLFMSNLRIL